MNELRTNQRHPNRQSDGRKGADIGIGPGLDDQQLMGPRLETVNPLLWEIGHLAWFHEFLSSERLDGRAPILASTDTLYDSMKVHHDTRWDLELPDLHGTFQYADG